jgi:hypothetical protein
MKKIPCYAIPVFILVIIVVPVTVLNFSGFSYSYRHVAVAKNTMKALAMAIEKYKDDLGYYPPDNINGSEMIARYLCQHLTPVHAPGTDANIYGPYIVFKEENSTADPDGKKRFLSPLGGEYSYAVIVDSDKNRSAFVIVDPGLDKKLGGTSNSKDGFVPDSTGDANDNLIYRSDSQSR